MTFDKYWTGHLGCRSEARDAWNYQQKEIDRLKQERAKLLECVSFYADSANWFNGTTSGYFTNINDSIDMEGRIGGKKARAILKTIGEDIKC